MARSKRVARTNLEGGSAASASTSSSKLKAKKASRGSKKSSKKSKAKDGHVKGQELRRSGRIRRREPLEEEEGLEDEEDEEDGDCTSLSPSSSLAVKGPAANEAKRARRSDSEGGQVMRSRSTSLADLNPDDLEVITQYLDTGTALALLRTCKTVYFKLVNAGGFWKALCKNENFQEYTVLRNEEGDPAASPSSLPRLTYSGEVFHDVAVPSSAPLWRKIFLRGIQMRRNICLGRFELWRLFLTDQDCLPVKKMTANTTFRELRSSHRRSPFNNPNRRVRIHRYWNEEYLVALLHAVHRQFNDIFVWSWKECQNPKFLYTFDLQSLYPTGLFPTAFFLYKNYLVLMPNPVVSPHGGNDTLKSMIRVHDLSNGMALFGSYDFPEDGPRRYIRNTAFPQSHEAAHLHKVGDTAVALCRTPELKLFVFSLPDCRLLREMVLPCHPEHPLEHDDLDQRFLMRDNTVIFMFHDRDFFDHFLETDENAEVESKHGRLLFVDFESFVSTGGPIEMRMDSFFDCSSDHIEKIAVLSKKRLVCSLNSGKIVVRDIIFHSDATASHVNSVVISCPEPIRDDFDSDLGTEIDSDGPTLCVSRSGKMIAEMRHFRSGRKLYAYTAQDGNAVYSIDLDHPMYSLTPNPGYVSVDMDGNFLCAADLDHIVVWNSRTGKFIRSIPIPKHYAVKEDLDEADDKYCWKGHTDFAFAEDGIIIIHSHRNFPVAADVILFW